MTNSGKQKIMVIDDDQLLIEYLADLFEDLDGVEACHFSYGGFEAGMQLRSFEPDIVLLDLMMPKLDGYTVCKLIKNDPLTRNIRIIAITGNHSEECEKQILAEGAEACIEKPIDTDKLFKLLGVGKYYQKI